MKIREDLKDELVLQEIGARLRAVRVRCRLKQEELAARCGISRKSLIRLEAGEGGIRLATFVMILRQLRILHSLDVAIPENTPTPMEVLEMEKKRKPLPKSVRTPRVKPKLSLRWGDGTMIDRGGVGC